jgi:hypothetical protein
LVKTPMLIDFLNKRAGPGSKIHRPASFNFSLHSPAPWRVTVRSYPCGRIASDPERLPVTRNLSRIRLGAPFPRLCGAQSLGWITLQRESTTAGNHLVGDDGGHLRGISPKTLPPTARSDPLNPFDGEPAGLHRVVGGRVRTACRHPALTDRVSLSLTAFLVTHWSPAVVCEICSSVPQYLSSSKLKREGFHLLFKVLNIQALEASELLSSPASPQLSPQQ